MAFPLNATAIYAGVLALIAVALAVNVSRLRFRTGVGLGDGGDEGLLRARSAFGNFAEYVPLALIVIGLIEMAHGPRWLVHALGVALVVGRVLHAQGLSRTSGWSFGRAAGMACTWAVLAVGGAVALYYGLIWQT